jgi:hypothetical protein
MSNRPNRTTSRSGAPPDDAPGDAPDNATTTATTDRPRAARGRGRKLSAVPDRKPLAAADRITVSLVAKAQEDLQKTHDRTGRSKTDIINRAITLYEFIEGELDAGAEIVIHRDGQDQYVKFL